MRELHRRRKPATTASNNVDRMLLIERVLNGEIDGRMKIRNCARRITVRSIVSIVGMSGKYKGNGYVHGAYLVHIYYSG